MDAADVLAGARRLIEERGWWDGTEPEAEDDGTLCAEMALSVAAGRRSEFDEACEAVKAEAGVDSIPPWNDSSSVEDVLLVMKRAEERLRS